MYLVQIELELIDGNEFSASVIKEMTDRSLGNIQHIQEDRREWSITPTRVSASFWYVSTFIVTNPPLRMDDVAIAFFFANGYYPLTVKLWETGPSQYQSMSNRQIIESTEVLSQKFYDDFQYLSLSREESRCIMLNAPHWFEREDFCLWLKSEKPYFFSSDGELDGDYQDVIMTIDRSFGDFTEDSIEGSHIGGAIDIPEDIRVTLIRIFADRKVKSGLVWIKPF